MRSFGFLAVLLAGGCVASGAQAGDDYRTLVHQGVERSYTVSNSEAASAARAAARLFGKTKLSVDESNSNKCWRTTSSSPSKLLSSCSTTE